MRILFITFIFLLFSNLHNSIKKITFKESSNVSVLADTIPENAKKLIKCYSNLIIGYSDNYIIFKDGSKIVWNDGKIKPFKELIDNPDLNDMFIQKYQKGAIMTFPTVNFDPGRIRNQIFFQKIYGKTEINVLQNLTEITWCPKLVNQKIRVTKLNGVSQRIIQISKELDEHPELKKYLLQIGGTFNWRKINGSNRLSLHSFGMTIDINTNYSDYWQWNCKCTNENTIVKYQNRIPQTIVEIFEKNGFIWGGKWYHFDTMHFEYRPELL